MLKKNNEPFLGKPNLFFHQLNNEIIIKPISFWMLGQNI